MTELSEPTAPPAHKSRTLFLTLLGSVVVPHSLVLWRETYVQALVELGLSTAAAGQAIERGVQDKLIVRERVGRRTRLHVTEEHREGLSRGSARVDAFGLPFDWDGKWLVVMLKVPEQSRSVRHHFRTQLVWLGFGSLGNGVWVSPHTENESQALSLFREYAGPQNAYVFRAAELSGTDPEMLAQIAWDMPALRARYDRFLSRFAQSQPQTPTQTWREWIELETAWRHFPLFDPELPESLLPDDWPRAEAFRLFHRRDERWHSIALDHIHEIEQGVTE